MKNSNLSNLQTILLCCLRIALFFFLGTLFFKVFDCLNVYRDTAMFKQKIYRAYLEDRETTNETIS